MLTGGASLGSIQVGMLIALEEAGVVPDLWVGTSVGALNAAYMAGRPGPGAAHGLAALWGSLRRRDVFPTDARRQLRGVAGREPSLVSPDSLRRLIESQLTYRNLEEAPVPVAVIAVDVLTSVDRALTRGPAVDAVLASAAIPGVFPPVQVGDRHFMDGGVVDNAPIAHAVALGATEVWVLPAGYACHLAEVPRSAIAMALQALNVLVQRRLAHDVRVYGERVAIRVVPPLCPVRIGPTDFGHSHGLIEQALLSTRQWIGAGYPPTAQLGLHDHDR